MTGRSDLRRAKPVRPAEPTRESAFDSVARAAAGGISRRHALRLAAGAVLASILPAGALRVAAAGAGVIGVRGYCPKPPPASCNPGENRTAWSSSCNNADNYPIPSGRPSTFNGCGPESGIDLKWFGKHEPPDRPLWLADFAQACNHHDCCYGTCGKPKAECDATFLEELLEACAINPLNLVDGVGAMYCAQIAGIYFAAVAGGGADAYQTAQQDACDCCVNPCQDISCGDFQKCEAGQCVCWYDYQTNCGSYCTDLQHDPENCGACGNVCDSQVCADGTCATG
jgi:group XII secretory phospholipase A2 precursor (PLA2G12)